MKIKELLRDPYSKTNEYLHLMRELTLLDPTERKLAIYDNYKYQYQNIQRLYEESCKEVTEPEELDYLDGLRKVYIEKFKLGTRFEIPYLKDIEDRVCY